LGIRISTSLSRVLKLYQYNAHTPGDAAAGGTRYPYGYGTGNTLVHYF
jgi:hypothetical protein